MERIADGDGRVLADLHDLARDERTAELVPSLRLDRDDFAIRTGERQPGSEAAAPARRDDTARLAAELLRDLDAGAALALDHPGIAEGVREDRTALRDQLGGDLVTVFARALVDHDFGPESAGRVELNLRRVVRSA